MKDLATFLSLDMAVVLKEREREREKDGWKNIYLNRIMIKY